MNPATHLRLRLRDFGAVAAFSSMAISGQLPFWVMGLFGFAAGLALFNRRIFDRQAKLTAALLLVLAAALYLSVAASQLDLVVAACSLAALVAGQRMLVASLPTTDRQVQLLGVLMVSGGAALSGELIYSLCLFAFAVLTSLSLGLSVIESAVTPGEEVPVRAALGPLSWGIAFALVGALAFFIFFPRLNWNIAARRIGPGLGVATTGFSDRVRLGSGTGTLKSSPRPVMRVQLSPDPGTEQLEAYWIGRTFERFDGQEWTHEGPSLPSAGRLTLARSAAQAIHQRIELLPAYGAQTAIALEQPLRLGVAKALGLHGAQPVGLVQVPGSEVRFSRKATAYSYEAFSSKAESTPVTTEQVEDPTPYLTLPATLDPRIKALAAKILEGESRPLQAGHKLERYLQKAYAYSLDLESGGKDPLAHFLFERKAGHCEHFATALTVLLRSQGIPARVATGFFGGERTGDSYVVRAGDAHAWTQVWVEGTGFVTLDATPASFRTAQSTPWLQTLLDIYEALEEQWRTRVVDYSFRDQLDFARSLSRKTRESPTESPAPSRWALPPLPAWVQGLAAAGFAYFLTLAVLRRLNAPQPTGKEATRLFERTQRLLKKRAKPAFQDAQEEPPLEVLAERLNQAHHPAAPSLATLNLRYREARFGQKPLAPGEAQALLAELKKHLRLPVQRQGSKDAYQGPFGM